VGGQPDDWQPPVVDGIDVPGSPGGALPGGDGLGEMTPPVSGETPDPTPLPETSTTPDTPGAPMMPGMPGPSGAPGAGNNGNPEKPDAGGLVDGDTDAWESSGVGDIGIPGAPNGTAAGGPGLGVPPWVGVTSELPWDAEAALGQAGDGVAAPLGVPGSAASPGDTSAPDQPGASEPIGAEAISWQPPGLEGAPPLAPDGAPAGGVGLTPATEVARLGDQGAPQAPLPGAVPGPGRTPTGDTSKPAAQARPVLVDSVVPPMEVPEPSADPVGPQDSSDVADPYLPGTPSLGESAPSEVPKPVAPPAAVDLPGTGMSVVETPAPDIATGPVLQRDMALVVEAFDTPHDPGADAAIPPDAELDGGRASNDDEALVSAATVGDEATSGPTLKAAPDSEPTLPVAVMGGAVGTGAAAAVLRRVNRTASVQPDDLVSNSTAGGQSGHAMLSSRRCEQTDEQEPLGRPDSAEFLRDEDNSWGEGAAGGKAPPGDDYVPMVRPDDGDDMSGWDDLDDSAWLTEAYTNDQGERSTDA
ncbi:hypothetical protein, partial [Salinispora arenicola]|uniref:hypothetical protein n=1 Tax=Salinispora arenicola TaxID=168697 RepID=UPI0003609F55